MDTKKQIFKRWWFGGIIIIFLCGIFVVAWISGHRQGNNSNNKKDTSEETKNIGNSGYSGDIFNSSLPDCPADLSGIFTHEVFDLAEVDQVMPLGMLSPGGHTIPTDHMNIAHFGTKRIAIYSPGDVTLTFMDDKITYDAETNQKLHDDYSVEIAPCKGISVWLNHFSELEPKILEAFTTQERWCDTGKYHFGDDMTTYYSPCQTAMNVKLSSGELMGYVGKMAGGIVTAATGIDLGAYNFNTAPHAFANPSRYEGGNLHSFCGIDLFSQPIKDIYYSKLGDLVADGRTVSMVPRVGEPKCGTDMQDVPGTLAGNWFVGTSDDGGVTRTQYQLALVHTLANANIEQISLQGQIELGGNTSLKFIPKNNGTINREWSKVTPGDQIYCYQNDNYLDANLGIGKDGKPMQEGAGKFLIELIDETHLHIEKQYGICGADEKFVNPFTYER